MVMNWLRWNENSNLPLCLAVSLPFPAVWEGCDSSLFTPPCPPAPCLQNTGTRRVTWFHSERLGGECWGRESSCYLFTFECQFVSSSGSPAPSTELSKQEFRSWSRWGVSSGVQVRQPYSDAHKAPGVWGEGRREEGAGRTRRRWGEAALLLAVFASTGQDTPALLTVV